MHLRWFGFSLSLVGAIFAAIGSSEPKETAESAVRRSLPLLQKSAAVWLEKTKCASCHHQSLGQVTVALARERGFDVNEKMAMDQDRQVFERRSVARFKQYEGTGAINGSAGFSFLLFGYAASKLPVSESTDALSYFLLSKQSASGYWPSLSHRMPLEDSPVTLTALAIRGLLLYAPDYLRFDAKNAVLRGQTWLANHRPKDNEEATFKLLGLAWGELQLRTSPPPATTLSLGKPPREDGNRSQRVKRTHMQRARP